MTSPLRGPDSIEGGGETATVHLMSTPPDPAAAAKTEFDLLGALSLLPGALTRR